MDESRHSARPAHPGQNKKHYLAGAPESRSRRLVVVDVLQVTARHYAQGSVVKNAAMVRVLGVLGSIGEAKRPSARAQLENLDEDTLAQLLSLLAETKQGGAPVN